MVERQIDCIMGSGMLFSRMKEWSGHGWRLLGYRYPLTTLPIFTRKGRTIQLSYSTYVSVKKQRLECKLILFSFFSFKGVSVADRHSGPVLSEAKNVVSTTSV